ncbi:enoyl-CoA hydratase [Aeromicrobium sp. PE09-221]|uniref:enoyl-CoA hydratase n=1 Tax=Aeromicrobium sp. PE09-221 TaxID=1898043 RepID=UPI000B3E98E6|nr:enoyl-CoA hydratase [Aeromicrobium sp. PE09-221]OUZ07340.1 enoyl-CoA hydratase [Aeromicrobium sp. PE09-221]
MSVNYEVSAEGIARITLDRVEKRNAQDTDLLYSLNECFDRAAHDDEVRVIVLKANGAHFSSGHDMNEPDKIGAMSRWETVGTWCGFSCSDIEAQMGREREMYLGFSERWRNIPKPTIAQVQGAVVAGGLMLVWPCDIIIAGESAYFQDTTIDMAVAGAEFFHHPWEVGVRRAKEMLFTGEPVTAREALDLGMVTRVVADDELAATVQELASVIARKPPFALKLVKQAVNAAQDAQGRPAALETSFALHQLSHAENLLKHGRLVDPQFFTGSRSGLKPSAPAP